jgi:hypothetical protein
MRYVALAFFLAGALLLAGCGSESPRQSGARVAVEQSLPAAEYDRDRTRCTDNPSPWFIERETDVFVCVAHRRDGSCARYRATLENAGWDVELTERRADCILPF